MNGGFKRVVWRLQTRRLEASNDAFLLTQMGGKEIDYQMVGN